MQCNDPSCDFSHSRTRAHLRDHARNGVPTVITFAEARELLPTRDDFIDPQLRKNVSAAVAQGKPLLFMPNATSEQNEYSWVPGPVDPVTRRASAGSSDPQLRLYLYGTLPCGSTTCVIIEDPPVYVLLEKPAHMRKVEFNSLVSAIIDGKATGARSWTKQRRMHGFQPDPTDWMRVDFKTLQSRKKFLDCINAYNRAHVGGINTANDDLGFNDYYLPVVARQYQFATAGWNRITRYEQDPKPDESAPHCTYVLRTRLADFNALDDDRRKVIMAAQGRLSEVLVRDHTLKMTWDIETAPVGEVVSGSAPNPSEIDTYEIFMMCSTWAWHWSADSLCSVCCVCADTAPRAGCGIIIECADEDEVLDAHTHVLGQLQCDIMSAFNGGHFDWPCYRAKMRARGKLGDIYTALSRARTWKNRALDESNIDKWSFRRESMKIDAENNHDLDCVAAFTGVIDIDILPIFLQLYTRAEVPKLASLNFFLEKNELASKADMPYKRMFQIYARAKMFRAIRDIGCHCKQRTRGIVAPNGVKCHCTTHDRYLDYVPSELRPDQPFPDDNQYTDTLMPAVADGSKCCWCSKRPQNIADMGDVAYYCTIDCVRPQQLCAKRVIVDEKRELSTLAYVSLYSSFFRAGGMKVRNLIGAQAHRFGVAFSNARPNRAPVDKDHYPGAWVCNPERRLNFDDPISGIDYSSLYPSLMMTYNISPEKVIHDPAERDRLTAAGYSLHQVGPFAYERGEKRGNAANQHLTGMGWLVRHNGIHEPAKDTRVITTYRRKCTFSKPGASDIVYYDDDCDYDEHEARLERYHADGYKHAYVYEPQYGRERLPGEDMGIFPYVLKRLFDMRKPVKAAYLMWSDYIDKMDKAGVNEWLVDGRILCRSDIEFNRNKVNSKQNGIKVLANTFYGESGNFQSPIFALIVAAGTTTAGVANITRVRLMIEAIGCHIHYGDTDSLYASPPRHVFAAARDAYERELGAVHAKHRGVERVARPPPGTAAALYKQDRIAARLRWMETIVSRAMKYMNNLTAHISLFLMRNNGTLFLNMAYEEVGLPTWFLGKKKYVMTPHMDVINFMPRTFFMRGIEIIKQGQTQAAVNMGKQFIHDAMWPDNEEDVMTLLEGAIERYYTSPPPPSDFAQKAKYKPDKKNVPVLRFIERMRVMNEQTRASGDPDLARVYELPDPGDKFTYVIARKEQEYTLRGTLVKTGKGDLMEFWRAYEYSQSHTGHGPCATAIMLDHDWYMTNSISGIMARFIAGMDQFQPQELGKYDLDTKEGYRAMDIVCIKNAQKYILESICSRFGAADPKQRGRVGKSRRSAFTAARKEIVSAAVRKHGPAGEFFYRILDDCIRDDSRMPSNHALTEQIVAFARADVMPLVRDGNAYMRAWMDAGLSPFTIWNLYANPRNRKSYAYRLCTHAQKSDEQLLRSLNEYVGSIAGDAELATLRIGELVRARATTVGSITPADVHLINDWRNPTAIARVYDIVVALRANEITRVLHRDIERACVVAKHNTVHIAAVPAVTAPRDLARRAHADACKSATRTGVSRADWFA